MNYLVFKSLHIISVVTWFAGLFYMPRLFVYFAEAETKNPAEKKILQDQFKIMQRRLWYGITWPSAIAVLIFGSILAAQFWPITQYPWLVLKLGFVALLYAYHIFLHAIFKQQQNNNISFSPLALRVINEISTIFLVAIVFLVVLKNVLSMVYGIVGLFVLVAILMIAIKAYKKIREREEFSMPELKNINNDDWKTKLNEEEYKILRMCGTERPFAGEYYLFFESGIYTCAGCGHELFSSETKYDSGSGWPAFYDVIGTKNIRLIEDQSLGMKRVEVRCSYCDSHLGHVFEDGPRPTGLRYCINSIALKHHKS
ncbi:MAG: peptide-methionine (R)-S-oxide reductase MsrB [Bacteriovorax sp.]|nr:peptide-methionine (R)-S-oxide reductase MsrB [Bacteriovorax sp.]